MKLLNKILILLIVILLSGCFCKPSSTALLYQEDFDGNCFRAGITWSEMALCLKNDRDKEWKQNSLANNLNNK